jgi:hypothetical protein
MKKIYYLSPLLLLFSCYNVDRKCSDFKTGKFKFEYEVNGVKKTTLFERKDSIELILLREKPIQPPFVGSTIASM